MFLVYSDLSVYVGASRGSPGFSRHAGGCKQGRQQRFGGRAGSSSSMHRRCAAGTGALQGAFATAPALPTLLFPAPLRHGLPRSFPGAVAAAAHPRGRPALGGVGDGARAPVPSAPAHPGLGCVALGLDRAEGKQGKGAPVLRDAPGPRSVIAPCCPPSLQPFPGHSRPSQPAQPPPPAFPHPLQEEHLKKKTQPVRGCIRAVPFNKPWLGQLLQQGLGSLSLFSL